jgi:hypothetical protein
MKTTPFRHFQGLMPVENWHIEIVENKKGLSNSPATRAVTNAQKYIGPAFILFEDGSLLRGALPDKNVNIFQIELVTVFNIWFLAELDLEMHPRKRKNHSEPWLLHGHVKDRRAAMDNLCLDDDGTFYFYNRRLAYQFTHQSTPSAVHVDRVSK